MAKSKKKAKDRSASVRRSQTKAQDSNKQQSAVPAVGTPWLEPTDEDVHFTRIQVDAGYEPGRARMRAGVQITEKTLVIVVVGLLVMVLLIYAMATHDREMVAEILKNLSAYLIR